MSGEFQVVQFIHPGFEYSKREHVGPKNQPQGVMPWKQGGSVHDRKFMVSSGSAYDLVADHQHAEVPLGFWGEWEGPSVYWRVASPGKPYPSIVHAPFRPEVPPDRPFQNTDPLVFGYAFVYSNCLQEARPVLRDLSPGSIVLFGRHSRVAQGSGPAFSLDTCLVIERSEKRIPGRGETFGEDLVDDMVLTPLETENFRDELTVYYGRVPSGVGPFSFFPARLVHDQLPLFARPSLTPCGALKDVVNRALMENIKVTKGLTATNRDAIWREVADQVTSQGCLLGYHAATPPTLTENDALRAASGSAEALT